MPLPLISARSQTAIHRRLSRNRASGGGADTQREPGLPSEQTETEQSEVELVSARIDFGKEIAKTR